MKFLAIDTSQEYLTVIANNDDKCEKIHLIDCASKHSVTLMDSVEVALERVNLTISSLDFCAVVVGAGSFTGIRIGIATVKGLCAVNNIKSLSITSFDTLAYSKDNGKYLAVIDAKHDNFYVCGYSDGAVTIEPKFINLEELNELKGYKKLSSSKIKGVETEICDTTLGLFNACLKKCNNVQDATELAPLYLRLSQAEEGRK